MSNGFRSFDEEEKEDSLIREVVDIMTPKKNQFPRISSDDFLKTLKTRPHARKR